MKFLYFVFLLLPATLAVPRIVAPQSLGATPVPCKGQSISRIDVSARPPFEAKGSGVQGRIARHFTSLHATTNPEVIKRFLALRPGMACTELRRLESERMLRSQPYLADATVTAFPDDAGGVYISVITIDEITIVLGGGGSGAVPYVRTLRLGEENFLGEAVSVVGQWRHSEDFRDNYSASVTDFQFLGRPYQLTLSGARNELGGSWGMELSHPFLTDLQRVSWRSTAGSREDLRFFRRPAMERAALLLQRAYADVGGVIRIGPPGKLALVGASISYEDEMPGSFPTAVADGRVFPDTTSELIGRYERHTSARLNALAGLRDVRYLRVTGFESLDGAQDMRQGFELATVIGRGVKSFGATETDLFASANLYAGVGNPSAFAAVETTVEGRRHQASPGWDGLLASGRVATYWKPATRNTVLSSLEWSAGSRQRIPFQLSLADREGGPRGYRNSWLAGGQRAVLRLEDRVFVGHLKNIASVGIAPFMDFAKLWEGDVPFGTTTGIHASAGISLLASVPPRSQRMWRMDLMLPLNRESGAKVSLRLVSRDFTRTFWKEPGDVQRNRERSVPTSVFNWP